MDIEQVVNARYGLAAQQRQDELCCPVEYDERMLDVIPDEIKERDYGCGDPSRFVREGDVVLDLGSGAGKVCYIAAQIVGPTGRVIGVDANDEMLALAEKYRIEIGERVGYRNVEFRKGRIQDLRLDLSVVDSYLAGNPITSAKELASFNSYCTDVKKSQPMIEDESVDLILSNCVLNLVRPEDKEQLFNEMFRVVRRGGRVAISDIVSDEDVPEELQRDPELWSGCIAGAYREDAFLDTFDRAGFYGMEIVKRDERPWRVVQGIEFRSITVLAFKGKQGPCLERRQAVIYRGPWRKVIDDDGHVLERGKRMAVCDKTFGIYQREPYAQQILPIHPPESKGVDYELTDKSGTNRCERGTDCC